ncbi:MAG: sugar phosphate isomerase/epimerase family protein [Planctomycetaceae bacterium]
MSDFIYCLNSSTIRPTPILDKIRIAGEVGYAAIELWHDDIDLHLSKGGTLSDIRQAVADQGLTVPTTIYLKGWAEPDEALRQRELDECKRRMEQSVAIGALHIIAGPPPGACDRSFVGAKYAELLDLGLAMGVKPAFEYLGFVDDINSIDGAIEVITNSRHPQATVVLDPFHCFRGGAGFESIAKLNDASIAISHFNDTPSSPPREQQHDHSRVMPGDGHMDLGRYLELLRQTGYRRWLSLELFREDLWSRDPREVAKLGLEKMRAVAEGG